MGIKIQNLSFKYSKDIVLDNISLDINDNTFTTVIGANGCGKTTLFKCIFNIIKGYSGEIIVNGQNTKNLNYKQISSLISYIPQSHYITFNYLVLDMVLMGMAGDINMFSSPANEDIKKAKAALKLIGIEYLTDRLYGNLSGGEQQLVLIARALAKDAKILLMDEPTSSLDFGNQIRIMQTVKDLNSKGYTIIMSSHNPIQTLQFSSDVAAIKDHKIIAYGKTDEILTKELINELYGINATITDTPYGKTIITD